MVLKPAATSSSETLPLPGAANKSNCPSVGEELAFTTVFCFSVVAFASVSVVFSAKVRVKFTSKFRNSNALKRVVTFSKSGCSNSKSLAWKLTGTSNIMVANFFESNPNSLAASTFSLSFPLSSWVLSSKFSIEP